MPDNATFSSANGAEASGAIRQELRVLTTPTEGDLLYVGQISRSRIRQRTFQGVDADGAPFAGYSQKGPYYLYVNADAAGSVRGRLAPSDAGMLSEVRHARRTAAANRYAKTGGRGSGSYTSLLAKRKGLGVRTPYGIRYDSYAAAKAAHGVTNVNLYGMQQHTHMLDTMIVRAGGAESAPGEDEFFAAAGGSDLNAFSGNRECVFLTIGFYGPEADRAEGNNEGSSRSGLPARRFFALSQEDLDLGAKAVAERAEIRAREFHNG